MSNPWEPDRGGVSRRRALVVGAAAAAAGLAGQGLPDAPTDGMSGSPPGGIGPSRVHEADATGAGVRVGVLGTTGFDTGHPALADAAVGTRSFDAVPVAVDGMTHGTAAAVTVARTAPEAELLLASFDRTAGFAAALDWLRRTGADIVLAPVAAHGAAAVGGGRVNEAAAAAVDAGVVVVAPTGNAARGHWGGSLGTLAVEGPGEPTRPRIRPLSREGPPEGELTAWVGSRGDTIPDLSLALVRLTATGDGRDLVALSRPDGSGAERLVAYLRPGRYVLELRLPDRSSVSTEGLTTPVEVTTPTHRLDPERPRGSVAAPASAPGVLAVGAQEAGSAAADSGRGPTPDGRPGVDLLAGGDPWPAGGEPGTSGAAAQAAGVAALALEKVPSLTPAALRRLLRNAVTPVPGAPERIAGAGVLDPAAAVRRARDH